ncbi:MAG TPA: alpha/beta hydrolase [Streptosporangiaceae bacterium]
MISWRRLTSVAGLAAGAAAAGAGVVIAAEKIAVGRIRLRPDPAAAEPLGQLHGRSLTVLASDGAALHAEISGPDDAPVTIIFSHGYALSQDVWHYQRAALAGQRVVCWDQRGHGRSSRAGTDRVTVDQLGADLHAVLTATVPGDGPVVLVGHSMGGMTIMALADQHPELFGSKVIGIVLISTAAAGVDPTAWLPAPLRPAARQVAPAMLRGASLSRPASMIERGRHAAGDLAFLGTRFMAFGDPQVSPAIVDYLERIIRATPVTVIADFYLALLGHDKLSALPVLGRVPVVVLIGDSDRVVPARFGEQVAAAIPGADLLRVPGAGHALILERPALASEVISELTSRALARSKSRGHGEPA